jgi:hypothetical protein
MQPRSMPRGRSRECSLEEMQMLMKAREALRKSLFDAKDTAMATEGF